MSNWTNASAGYTQSSTYQPSNYNASSYSSSNVQSYRPVATARPIYQPAPRHNSVHASVPTYVNSTHPVVGATSYVQTPASIAQPTTTPVTTYAIASAPLAVQHAATSYTTSHAVATSPTYTSGAVHKITKVSVSAPVKSQHRAEIVKKIGPDEEQVIYQTVAKKQPVKKQRIHLECGAEESGTCEYILIKPNGAKVTHKMTGGEDQIFDAESPWKIMFRQAADKEWVGYVLKPGHRYALDRDDDDLWTLYEID